MIVIILLILIIFMSISNISCDSNIDKNLIIELPRDDGYINRTEVQWWYWTGHITDDNNNRYGYEMCFFTVLG